MNSSLIIALGLAVASFHIQSSSAAKCTYYGESRSGPTGEVMANGEHFDSSELTCSTLPHLALGSVLRVTNQRNGRSITVRVTDRIAAARNEDTIDLTYGAFGLIANHDDGVVPCSYTVV